MNQGIDIAGTNTVLMGGWPSLDKDDMLWEAASILDQVVVVRWTDRGEVGKLWDSLPLSQYVILDKLTPRNTMQCIS